MTPYTRQEIKFATTNYNHWKKWRDPYEDSVIPAHAVAQNMHHRSCGTQCGVFFRRNGENMRQWDWGKGEWEASFFAS